MGLRDLLADYVTRKLQARDPQTFVEGGGNLNTPDFIKGEPDRDELERYEAIYKASGVVGSLLEKRALMTFGVGTEWATDDDDVAITIEDDRGVPEQLTVADWLEREWPTRQRDSTLINLGTTVYWAGNAFAELRRTRDGGFHALEPVNPVTISALWDDHGEVQEWVQRADANHFQSELTARLDTDDISHFALYRVGRHPLGISVVGRAIDDINRFHSNQSHIAHALERFAYPGWQWKVGAEDGPVIDDQELRRVRSRARQLAGARNLVTGRDIDISALDNTNITEGINRIAENDIRNLATALDIPLEWTNYGGDGLGTGTPAESRQTAFERRARTEQRRLTGQLIDQVARVLIEESPFPDDVHIDLRWGDVVSDQQAVAEYLGPFSWAYHRDEIRDKLGDAPWEGAGEDDDPPELDPMADRGGDGGMGGIFDQVNASDGGPDTGNVELGTDSQLSGGELGTQSEFDGPLLRAFEHVVGSDDTDRQLFNFDDEDMPEFAKARVRDAIQGGALFSNFDSVPGSAVQAVKDVMLDSLEEQHGWSLDSIAENLMDATGISRDDAEVIARTESAAILNRAREIGYEEEGQGDARFYWQGPGPNDNRISDACAWLVSETNPQHGGTPVSLERLKELVGEAPRHDADMANDLARPNDFVVHPQERHTFVRHVE